MTFLEAFEEMKKGCAVARKIWRLGDRWQFDRYAVNALKNFLIEQYNASESSQQYVQWIWFSDLFAEDWYVYSPPPKRTIAVVLGDDVPEGYDGKYEIGEDGKLHPAVEYDAC